MRAPCDRPPARWVVGDSKFDSKATVSVGIRCLKIICLNMWMQYLMGVRLKSKNQRYSQTSHCTLNRSFCLSLTQHPTHNPTLPPSITLSTPRSPADARSSPHPSSVAPLRSVASPRPRAVGRRRPVRRRVRRQRRWRRRRGPEWSERASE